VRTAVAVVLLAFAAAAAAHPLMTKSQARAIVRDVNLNGSDMAKYHAFPSDASLTSANRRSLTRIARCSGGVPPSRGLASGSSPVFLSGSSDDFDIFWSFVTVFPTAKLVRSDLRALRRARGRDCLRTEMGEGAPVTVTTLRAAVSGVSGYRFVQQGASDASTTLYVDYIFMGTGAGEATLIIGSHPEPPAQTLEDKVIRIVHTRLKARLDPDTVL
jgi:hypothetical protein